MLVKSKGRLLAVTQLQLPIPNELVEAQQDVNAFDGRRRSNIYIYIYIYVNLFQMKWDILRFFKDMFSLFISFVDRDLIGRTFFRSNI